MMGSQSTSSDPDPNTQGQQPAEGAHVEVEALTRELVEVKRVLEEQSVAAEAAREQVIHTLSGLMLWCLRNPSSDLRHVPRCSWRRLLLSSRLPTV